MVHDFYIAHSISMTPSGLKSKYAAVIALRGVLPGVPALHPPADDMSHTRLHYARYNTIT